MARLQLLFTALAVLAVAPHAEARLRAANLQTTSTGVPLKVYRGMDLAGANRIKNVSVCL